MNPALDLEQLVSDYYLRIRRAATLLAGDSHEADDLAQETFAQATLSYQKFRGASDPFVWLYGILLNVDRKRRRRIHVWLRHITAWIDLRTSGEVTEISSDATADVWSLVRTLPARQQQAIVLRFAEGFSYAQIAEAAKCPEGTAKSRVFHGLKSLRMMMSASGDLPSPIGTELDPALSAEMDADRSIGSKDTTRVDV